MSAGRIETLIFGSIVAISSSLPLRGGELVALDKVVYLHATVTFEAVVSELELVSDGFETLPIETYFRPDPVQLFDGNFTITETNTFTTDDSEGDHNRIVALPSEFGTSGIDSHTLSGHYLLARTQKLLDRGEQYVTFSLDFGRRVRGIGFHFSGAAGGTMSESGAHCGVEITTLSGLVYQTPFPADDGFFGAVSTTEDVITSVRLYDQSVDRLEGPGEVFAIDNLVVALARTSPVLPHTSFKIQDSDPDVHLGESVAALGDVNDDGVPDFALSGTKADFGIVRVYSGADGRIIHTITRTYPGRDFGKHRNLIGLGDLDGDGAGEIAVGSPGGSEMDPDGLFDIYRGRDGTLLRSHMTDKSGTSLGHEIATLGDLDSDGVPDYAASSFELGSEGGEVRVYSGSGGEELVFLTSEEAVRFHSIAGAGDMDRDGRGDLAITLWSEDERWKRGEVRVLSGVLFSFPNPTGPVEIDVESEEARQAILIMMEGRTNLGDDDESIGLGLNGLGDIDGDGIPDLGAGTGPGDDALLFSGADGSRIHEWKSNSLRSDSQLVVETEGIGDIDGDGMGDVVIGRTGHIDVMSGRDGSLLIKRVGGGELGEEIAAIGDLDGDGVSEILAGAPAGGYAELISFSLVRGPAPDSPSGLTTRRQGNRFIVAWNSGLEGAVLEESAGLESWQPVENVMFDTLYVRPLVGLGEHYYRLRFAENGE